MTSARYNLYLSVIIPVFNDAEVLPELNRRLQAVLPGLCTRSEVIFIDDGSRDDSIKVLLTLQAQHSNIKVIQFTRNFGQPAALAAGLNQVLGDLVVLMDSDLQDRPEDIEVLLETLHREQTSMALACWSDRKDSLINVAFSNIFNAIANKVTDISYPPRARVFRAMTREVVEVWKSLPSHTATPLSLIHSLGYDYVTVELARDQRVAGSSGYTLRRRLNLSLERIFSSSLFPLRLASYAGLFLILISLSGTGYGLIRELGFAPFFAPWILVLIVQVFLAGSILVAIGIVGAYIGRIYDEVRQRPRYVIKKIYSNPEGE